MLALCASSCSAVLNFHECDVDADCAGTATAPLYCSDDHMCVGAIPDYLLCKVSVPTDGKIPDGALVIGGLFRTSGANDVNDHTFRQAADLAATEFIGSGYNVAHVVCDTAGDSAQAARAYNVVIDRFGAKVIVGPRHQRRSVRRRQGGQGARRAHHLAFGDQPEHHLPRRRRPGVAHRRQRQPAGQGAGDAAVGRRQPLDIIFVDDSAYANGLKDAFIANFPGQVTQSLGFAGGDTATMNGDVADGLRRCSRVRAAHRRLRRAAADGRRRAGDRARRRRRSS